jgi:RsiW-degrading membrane proteinase PrsW (M82 family)
MTQPIIIIVSLFPVFVFLVALIFLDSFKLVNLRAVLQTILVGCAAAALCLFLNSGLMNWLAIYVKIYVRYVAPVTEELFKAIYLVYLIRAGKVGFMVDAAIYGFALGAGFALVENVYYLYSLHSSNILLWLVRGFGTAIMHGGTTAVFGMVAKSWTERKSSEAFLNFVPAFLFAIVVHSAFNHFILPPVLTTLILMISLPTLILFVFEQSERATRRWLGVGFDTDVELLDILNTGKISETRIGQYLQTLRAHFPGEIVADMLCLLRIHLELAIRAKGILLMRQTGFKPATDPEIKEKFIELSYLEKSIGKTGQLAILPFLHTSRRDLWQLYMLGK